MAKEPVVMNVTVTVQPGATYVAYVEHLHLDGAPNTLCTPPSKVAGQQLPEVKEESQASPDPIPQDLLVRLLPMFKGNKAEVTQFYNAIRQSQPTVITTLVNGLVRDKVILSDFKNKPLWSALNDSGIYPLSLSNWNDQIK